MNYYARAQQVLAASDAQSRARLAHMNGLRGLGQAAGLPAGSQLIYSVTFDEGLTTFPSVAAVAQQLSTVLSASWGISTIKTSPGSGMFAQPQFSMTVRTLSDRNSQDDVKAIMDGRLQDMGFTGINSSIITLTAAAASPGTPPNPQQPFDLRQFLSDNWPWLALAAGGLVFLSDAL